MGLLYDSGALWLVFQYKPSPVVKIRGVQGVVMETPQVALGTFRWFCVPLDIPDDLLMSLEMFECPHSPPNLSMSPLTCSCLLGHPFIPTSSGMSLMHLKCLHALGQPHVSLVVPRASQMPPV